MRTPEEIAKVHAEFASIAVELKRFIEQCQVTGTMKHDEAVRYALVQMVAELRVELRQLRERVERAEPPPPWGWDRSG